MNMRYVINNRNYVIQRHYLINDVMLGYVIDMISMMKIFITSKIDINSLFILFIVIT